VLEVVGIEVVAVDVGLADLVNVGVYVSDGDFVGAVVGMSSLSPSDWNTRVKFLKLMEPIPVAASQPLAVVKPVTQHTVWDSANRHLPFLSLCAPHSPTTPFLSYISEYSIEVNWIEFDSNRRRLALRLKFQRPQWFSNWQLLYMPFPPKKHLDILFLSY